MRSGDRLWRYTYVRVHACVCVCTRAGVVAMRQDDGTALVFTHVRAYITDTHTHIQSGTHTPNRRALCHPHLCATKQVYVSRRCASSSHSPACVCVCCVCEVMCVCVFLQACLYWLQQGRVAPPLYDARRHLFCADLWAHCRYNWFPLKSQRYHYLRVRTHRHTHTRECHLHSSLIDILFARHRRDLFSICFPLHMCGLPNGWKSWVVLFRERRVQTRRGSGAEHERVEERKLARGFLRSERIARVRSLSLYPRSLSVAALFRNSWFLLFLLWLATRVHTHTHMYACKHTVTVFYPKQLFGLPWQWTRFDTNIHLGHG